MRPTIPNRACRGIALALLISSVAGIRILGANDFFAEGLIWRVGITISPENIAKLRKSSRVYVPATFHAFGRFYAEVGVHLKGSQGSFRSIDEKPCLTLSFSKFHPENRFHGLEKIHLNNSVEDASYLNELIGSELFRAADVPAPRVAHAIVELNGRQLGFYVVKEGFEGEFLRRNFSQATGNLYDTDRGHDIDRTLKRQSGLGADAQEDLRLLAKAATEPDLSQRWQRLQEVLDVDRFITFMALEVMIGHRDGYSLARNNFRIYHDPEKDKLIFLPAGMDQLFGKADTSWKPNMAGLVAKAMMEIPVVQKRYSERFANLLNDVFVPARLCLELNSTLATLGKDLDGKTYRSISSEAETLCRRLKERKDNLLLQLSRPSSEALVFTHGEAILRDWRACDAPPGGGLRREITSDGAPLLQISAGPATSASWRTTAMLKRGHYRFKGKARTVDVTPLPFGNNQGAGLRIGGKRGRSSGLLGTSTWAILEVEFDVESPEEEVELICELRANAGTASFDRNSLELIKSD